MMRAMPSSSADAGFARVMRGSAGSVLATAEPCSG
jgi:hypothetical protein